MKVKYLAVFEFVLIVVLIFTCLGLCLYYDDGLSETTSCIMVDDESTAIKVAEAVIESHRAPLKKIIAKDLGNYWYIGDDSKSNAMFCMYIRKIDGCIVYCNMYGIDDVPESDLYRSKREVEQMRKEILQYINENKLL